MLQRLRGRELQACRGSFLAGALLAALAVALAVALGGLHQDLGRSLEACYRRLHFQDLSVEIHPAPPAVARTMANLPGVIAVEARATGWALLDGEATRLYGLPSGRRPQVNDLAVTAGRYLAGPGEILLERGYAERHGLRPGQEVRLLRDDGGVWRYTLVGLVTSPEFFWVALDRYEPLPLPIAVAWLGDRDLARMLGDESVDELLVRASSPAVAEAITRKLGPLTKLPPLTRAEQPSHALLTRAQAALGWLTAGFCLLNLLLGAAALGFALWRVVRASRPQIGLLLTLGFAPRRVASHYLALGMLPALAGALAGAVLGMLASRPLLGFFADLLRLPEITWSPPWTLALSGIVATLLVAAAFCALAVRPLLSLTPLEARRADFSSIPAGPGPRGVPLLARLAWRELARHRWRALGSALVMALGMAQLVAVWSFHEGQRQTLDFYFRQVVRYDLQVEFDGPVSAAALPPVRNWPGVSRAEPVLRVRGSLTSGGRSTMGTLWGLAPDARLWGLFVAGQELAPPAPGELLAGTALVRQLGAGPGARVEFRPERVPQATASSWRLGAELDEAVQNPGKVNLRSLQRALADQAPVPPDAVSYLWLQVSPGRRAEVRRLALAWPGVRKVEERQDLEASVRGSLAALTALQALLLALSVALLTTLSGLFSVMSWQERAPVAELLLHLGVAPAAVQGMGRAEVVWVWLAALVPGLAAGWLASRALAAFFPGEFLSLPMQVTPVALAGAAGLALAAGLAASHLAGRRALQRLRRGPQ